MPSPILPSERPGGPCAPGPAELPELQLVPVPAGWPPYDCEVHGAGCQAEPGRAGPGPAGPGSFGVRAAAGDDRAARAAGTRRASNSAAGALPCASGASPCASGASPAAAGETTAWPRQFGRVIVEVLAGERAPRQLTAWATDHARAQVEALVRDLASVQRPRIQRIITSWPTAQVVEMTMVVRFGPRSRALALRFEQAPARKAAPGLPARPARWLCTEIEAG